jgi:5-methyltetrahydrofolate--homocysteine methyltransferase
MEEVLRDLREHVLNGDRAGVEDAVRRAVEAEVAPVTVLNEGLIAAMSEVGVRFEREEFYVPEMLVAAKAMQAGLALLKPRLVQAGVPVAGKVVLGTVMGDLHDIGKCLVGMMLEGAGFEVIDLGTDVPPEEFAMAVRTEKPQLLGLSALLTTTMPSMKATLEALRDAAVRNQVKVMVGGAPVTESFAAEIGADGYAPDASRAATLAKALLKQPWRPGDA